MEPNRSAAATWTLVALLSLFILGKGIFTFYLVGDKGPPDWEFRPVADVPGQSPYAIYETLPHPQHVRGAQGK